MPLRRSRPKGGKRRITLPPRKDTSGGGSPFFVLREDGGNVQREDGGNVKKEGSP